MNLGAIRPYQERLMCECFVFSCVYCLQLSVTELCCQFRCRRCLLAEMLQLFLLCSNIMKLQCLLFIDNRLLCVLIRDLLRSMEWLHMRVQGRLDRKRL